MVTDDGILEDNDNSLDDDINNSDSEREDDEDYEDDSFSCDTIIDWRYCNFKQNTKHCIILFVIHV